MIKIAAANNNNNNTTINKENNSTATNEPERKKGWGTGLLQILTKPNHVIKQVRQTALQIRSIKDIFLKGSDKDICDHVHRNPESCCSMYPFGELGNQFPLIIVCRRSDRLSVETIEMVYDANPDAIMGTLHHACARKPSLEVIKFLLSKHPDGAKTERKGWLPLHTAVAGKAPVHVVEYLLDCYPESIQARECNELRLPIHIAVEHHASLDVIKLLVSRYPEGLKLTDYQTTKITHVRGWIKHCSAIMSYNFWAGGGLPLHLACRDNCSMEYLKYLIFQYPDALRTKNSSGWLPLHYACFAGANLKVIQMLVSCCPEAILEHTVDFRFPVDMSACRFNPSLAVVQYLISKHPTTICEPPVDLFYHYYDEAAATYASAHVIEFLRKVTDQGRLGYSFVYPREEALSW